MDFSQFGQNTIKFIGYLAFTSKYSLAFWVAVIWLVVLLNWRSLIRALWRNMHLINDLVVEGEYLKKISKPMQILLVTMAVSPFLHFVPNGIGKILERIAGFAAPFLTLYIIAQAFDLVVLGFYMQRKQTQMPNIVRVTVLSIIYIVFGMVFLEWAFGVNVLPLLATSTVLTAVLGLAMQDTLKNLFAGLTMSFEKRFHQGDWVMFRIDAVNTVVGEVKEIGWRTTKLRTLENNFVIIPNATFTSNQLTNYSLPTAACARALEFPVSPHSKLDLVHAALEKAASVVDGVLREPPIEVAPVAVKTDHIVYRLRFWIADFPNSDLITGLVMERCLEELVKLKVVPAVQ